MQRPLPTKSEKPMETFLTGERHQPIFTHNLEGPQALALEALMDGKTSQEAAEAAGVDRDTLYRWQVSDGRFMRALENWRKDTLERVRNRLAGLRAVAAQVVQTAIERGDKKLAVQVLKRLQPVQRRPATAESPDPRAIASERWLPQVLNPGSQPEAVEAFLMKRFEMTTHHAGNVTYCAGVVDCPLSRLEADTVVQELKNLGAYAYLHSFNVVKMPEGDERGPHSSLPSNAATPATIDPGLVSSDGEAHMVKITKRREELAAMDTPEEKREKEWRQKALKELTNSP